MKNIINIFVFAFCLIFASISWSLVPQATGFENGTSELFQDGTGSGTRSVQGTVKKTGNYALRVNPTTSGVGAIAIGCPSAVGNVATFCNIADAYPGFYYRVDTLPASGYIWMAKPLNTGAGAMLHIRLNSNGTIAVADSGNTLIATGSTVLSTGTWYRIEMNVKPGGSAAFTLKINGATEVSGTANQGGSNFGLMQLGKLGDTGANTVDMYYDDYVLSDSGFLGNVAVKTSLPTAKSAVSGLSQWSGDYTDVDDIPSDDTSTVMLSFPTGVNRKQYFQMQNASDLGIAGSILAVIAYSNKRESLTSGITSATQNGIYSGGAEYLTTAENITSAFAQRIKIFSTDPATGIAWTSGGFDAMEVGVVEGNNVEMMATQVHAQVVYQDVSSTPTPTVTVTATATATATLTPTVTATATATPIVLRCTQMLEGVGS